MDFEETQKQFRRPEIRVPSPNIKLDPIKPRETNSKIPETEDIGEEKQVEANEYILAKFKSLGLKERYQIIKENWFGSTLNLKHFKSVLTLFAFYKSLVFFVTR